MDLRIVEFSESCLQSVQGFSCGTDDWCQFAERWIKSAPPFEGALRSIAEYANTVWLFFMKVNGEEFLVGFGSLGKPKGISPPDRGFIPMLAVASSFQGMPKCAERRYSDAILDHIIGQARERGYREVRLYVHEKNSRAIRFYEKHSFRSIGTKDSNGNLRMLRTLG